jgi:hypothetical protein
MKRLSEGNIAIARAVCDIMKERLFLKILQSKIDTADKEFWSANKEIDQIDKFLGNLPETPDNHEIFRQAVDERRSHLDQQGKHMSAGSALRAEWTEHLWRLGPLCLAHMENLNKCICEITIAMRNEIDFTISEKSFKDISTGTMEKMSIIIQQMQADSKKIAEDMMTRPY